LDRRFTGAGSAVSDIFAGTKTLTTVDHSQGHPSLLARRARWPQISTTLNLFFQAHLVLSRLELGQFEQQPTAQLFGSKAYYSFAGPSFPCKKKLTVVFFLG
jgi:hypothetical protein